MRQLPGPFRTSTLKDIPTPRSQVDARGALCPLPTVKSALALEQMAPGDVLELLADDPVTKRDLPAWCRGAGHVFLGIEEDKGFFHIYIQRGRLPTP